MSAALVVLTALYLADMAVTVAAVSVMGAVEVNPLFAAAAARGDWAPFVAAKAFGVGLVWLGGPVVARAGFGRAYGAVLAAFAVVYAVALAWNVAQVGGVAL